MAFTPGKSGNPSGRKKLPTNVADVREMARLYTRDAIAALVEIVRSAKSSDTARVAAANVLLDRGHGKALQQIETKIGFFESMNDHEQRSLLAAIQLIRLTSEGDGSGAETSH